MSKERAIEFSKKMAGDPALKNRIQGAKSGDEVLQIAREQGFEITFADIQSIAANSSGELSNEQLEAVAGGVRHQVTLEEINAALTRNRCETFVRVERK